MSEGILKDDVIIKEEPHTETDCDFRDLSPGQKVSVKTESLDSGIPDSCKEDSKGSSHVLAGLSNNEIKEEFELGSELLWSLENTCSSLKALYETDIKPEISLEYSCCIQQILLQDCMVRLERLPITSLPKSKPKLSHKKVKKSRKKLNKKNKSISKQNVFMCDFCGKQCARKFTITQHILGHMRKPYICPICQKKFDYPSSLKNHEKTHSGEKNFKCELCERMCSTKAILKKHVQNHMNNLPFKCDVCKRQFIRERFLIEHLRSHTGEKPYECEVCGKQIKYKSSLTDHLRTHSGGIEKTLSCDFCEFRCSRKSHLIIHERNHTGERPYHCGVCKKNFISKSVLNTHMRLHSGELYKCDLCQMGYVSRGQLAVHKKTHYANAQSPFGVLFLTPDAKTTGCYSIVVPD